MLKRRLIAVLILRQGQVVQSVRFRHTNVIHFDAIHAVEAFSKWAVDEIVMLNVSREEESRQQFAQVVENISRHCFVPLTTGGWVTNADYAQTLLRNGADKLVFNTAVATHPALVSALARKYGSQCIVVSMDVKRDENGTPLVWIDRGRQCTGMDPVTWVKQAKELGAGEILFNSIDHDGARKGYDLESIRQVCQATDLPVIAFGGVFTWDHLVEGIQAGADACAAANILHYTEQSTKRAKAHLARAGVPVRKAGQWE